MLWPFQLSACWFSGSSGSGCTCCVVTAARDSSLDWFTQSAPASAVAEQTAIPKPSAAPAAPAAALPMESSETKSFSSDIAAPQLNAGSSPGTDVIAPPSKPVTASPLPPATPAASDGTDVAVKKKKSNKVVIPRSTGWPKLPNHVFPVVPDAVHRKPVVRHLEQEACIRAFVRTYIYVGEQQDRAEAAQSPDDQFSALAL